MRAYNIKWKKADLIKLGKAVSNFNKKIREVQNEENKLYLPDERNYQDLKQTIKTRQELNRIINSMKRFSKEGAEDLYTTEAGEVLTKWERRELSINLRSINRRLNKQIKELETPITPDGYSKAQMGSLVPEALRERIEKNRKAIETSTGKEFQRLKSKFIYTGRADYEYKKLITWKDNYINVFRKYSHLDNYDILEKKFNSLSNPESFYEFFSKDELIGDLTYNSDTTYSQQEFNSYLERLGLLDNDYDDSLI